MTTPLETHLPCSACQSTDALSRWEDHTFCFSCSAWSPLGDAPAIQQVRKKTMTTDMIQDGYFSGLPARKITEETCKRFDYKIAKTKNGPVHLAHYRNQKGEVCAQKVRGADKAFRTTGTFDDVQLFGQHMWPLTGKRLVVVEGELDALSYGQVTTWPVVSIPNGAQSAAKAIRRNISFIEGYDSVVFMFDNDEQGIKAAKQCAEIVTPGKAKIVTLPLKDASEMLMANQIKQLISSVYNAAEERPDGVINANELWEEVSKPQIMGTPYPFESWNKVLFGIHPREITTLTAGSGCGKSTISAQVAHHLAVTLDHKIGYIALEESTSQTALRFMSLTAGKALHIPNDATEEQKRAAFDGSVGKGNVILYDHFGSHDSDRLLNKMTYMVVALGCKFLVLDHLTILLSGGEFMVEGGDERKQIDYVMSRLRQFTEQYQCSILLISHLKRSGGDKGFEDGALPVLSSLRGSQSIAQISDSVIAVSRNASEGENTLTVRCLKNRRTGKTGLMGYLAYDESTAILSEVEPDAFEDVTEF